MILVQESSSGTSFCKVADITTLFPLKKSQLSCTVNSKSIIPNVFKLFSRCSASTVGFNVLSLSDCLTILPFVTGIVYTCFMPNF